MSAPWVAAALGGTAVLALAGWAWLARGEAIVLDLAAFFCL